MRPGRFHQLVVAVKRASFASNRLAVVRQAAATNYFTCAQVGKLVRSMSFSSGRMKVIQATASRIVDYGNTFTILSALSFSGEKRRAQAIFKRYTRSSHRSHRSR